VKDMKGSQLKMRELAEQNQMYDWSRIDGRQSTIVDLTPTIDKETIGCPLKQNCRSKA